MTGKLWTTLVASAVALASLLAAPVSSAAAARPSPELKLVGFTGNGRLIVNDHSDGRVYAVATDGSGATLLHTHAKALVVAGHYVEYQSLVGAVLKRYYLDVRTDVSTPMPSDWQWLTTDGGLRLVRHGGGWHLHHLPVSGPQQDWGVLANLPARLGDVSVSASPDGLVVVANHNNATKPPAVDFFPDPTAAPHTAIDLGGRHVHDGLACPQVTATISCHSLFVRNEVVGIDPTGAAPTVAKVHGTVAETAFRSGSTTSYAYTTYGRSFDTHDGCPCTLRFSNGATIGHLGSARILSDDAATRFVYFVERAHGRDLGIFRARFGSTKAVRVIGPNLP